MIDYKPLDETRNEIRVLSLCPEQHAGLVRCRLEHVSLDEALDDYSQFVVSTPPTLSRRNSYDLWHAEANERYHHHHHHHRGGADTPPDRASAHPRYYRFAWGDYGALSYTWGDQSQTRPILLNDTVFHVGRNLEAALRRLARHPDYADGGLKLWVDAICINQGDLRERGRQVRRMGDIFSRALIVTIWLGELPSDTTDGMAELQTLVSRCRDDSATKDAVEEALKKDRELSSALHAAVERLVTVTYWTRTWIIQEKCLGPFNASLLFGPHAFSLIPLRNFLACANNIQGAIRKRESAWQILKLMELAVRHQERQPAGRTDAEQKRIDMDDLGLLLMLGRLAHTTDPRDKLYGLLGLLPRYVSRHIEPDYALPVERVFADFARALVHGFDTLDLVLAGNSPPGSAFASPFVDAVPSWVPDLADRWDPYLWSTNCDATPRHPRPLGLEIEDEGATLVVKGVVCDVVAGTAPQLGWAAGVLSVLLPAQQIEEVVVTPPPPADADLKTAIVRTLHRDAALDCLAAATLLDIPWLDGLRLDAEEEEEDGEEGADEEKAQRIEQRRLLLARGWGPVLRHANFADFQQFRVRLDAHYAPWPGRRFRDFFPRGEEGEEEDGHLSGERQAEFLAALEKHAGIVYPILTTRRGRFGTSIHPARVGDVVAVVPGCYAPVLLRRDKERGGVWRSVSHCYVEGLMKGEAMEWLERGEVGLEELRIV